MAEIGKPARRRQYEPFEEPVPLPQPEQLPSIPNTVPPEWEQQPAKEPA